MTIDRMSKGKSHDASAALIAAGKDKMHAPAEGGAAKPPPKPTAGSKSERPQHNPNGTAPRKV